jgi:hypothetical protein
MLAFLDNAAPGRGRKSLFIDEADLAIVVLQPLR